VKPVVFIGDALVRLRNLPDNPRRDMGFQIDRLQNGLEPDDWKPMVTIGVGVSEVRVRDVSGAFRVIYTAKLADAVYILHAFQKKTQSTTQRDLDLDLAAKRFGELMRKVRT
jgi:phage-related protein